MFNCGKTQIDTILKNKELNLALYESNAPGSRVHTSKVPCASEYAKINEALFDWYVLATSNNIYYLCYGSTTGTSKLTHNHCEVHCNMIIFMLCHCVVDYSDIQ